MLLLKINAFSAIFILAQKNFSVSQALVIKASSNQYEDALQFELENQQKPGTRGIISIFVHCKCVDKYCYKKSIIRATHKNI